MKWLEVVLSVWWLAFIIKAIGTIIFAGIFALAYYISEGVKQNHYILTRGEIVMLIISAITLLVVSVWMMAPNDKLSEKS